MYYIKIEDGSTSTLFNSSVYQANKDVLDLAFPGICSESNGYYTCNDSSNSGFVVGIKMEDFYISINSHNIYLTRDEDDYHTISIY